MVITMAIRTINPYVCLLVVFITGASAGPIEHASRTTEGHSFDSEILRSKPKISVIDLSGANTIPRQRNFDKQFSSPHTLPDLLRSSNVVESPSETFGQKTKSTSSGKPAKHSFYIVTPTANLKRETSQKKSNANPEQKSHATPASQTSSGERNKGSTDNKVNESFVIKRDSNRFDAPAALSSTEDVLTDAGLLSSFGSSLFSNDALSGQRDTHSFGIPLPSSPPINSDSSVFTPTPENSFNSQDILSLTQNLSPQDVTAFTNSLSPEEVTSLTRNLLKSLNIESKDLDNLLNLNGPGLTSNLQGSTGGPGQAQSFGIPLPNSNSIDAFESASRTRASGASVPRTNSHAIGIPLPEFGSHSSSGNLGKELSSSASISTGNSASSFGVPLPGLNSDSASNGFSQSQSGGSISTGNSASSFGVPLPGFNSDSASNSFSQSEFGASISTGNSASSFGVPLPGFNSDSASNSFSQSESGASISTGNSASSFGVPLPGFNSDSASNSFSQSESGASISTGNSVSSFGVPLPGFNSDSASNSFSQSQSVGIPLPERGSDVSSGSADQFLGYNPPTPTNNFQTTDQSNSFGIPLPNLNSNFISASSGNQANSEQTFSVGIPLPALKDESTQSVGIPLPDLKSGSSFSTSVPVTGLNDISQAVGIPLPKLNFDSSQSVGVPLPELKSDVSTVGIPLPGLTSVSSADGFGQTQTFGVPLPRLNQGTASSSHDSLSEASGQSHSLGIPLPGLSSGAVSDGLNNVKSVGIPLPGINPDDSGNNFFTPLTVVSEGNTQFSLTKDGNNNILSSSSSAKLSPVFVGTSDDEGKKTVTVGVNVNTKSDPLDGLTIGQLLMGMNGQNGIVVLPMSSLNDVKSKASGLTVVTDSSAEGDDKIVVNLSNTATTTSAPAATTTRRARRTTTTTKAPDKFRVTLSDLLYSKGQWFGTLFGGMIDYGRIAWNTVQDHINSQPTYGPPPPAYGSYNTYGG